MWGGKNRGIATPGEQQGEGEGNQKHWQACILYHFKESDHL